MTDREQSQATQEKMRRDADGREHHPKGTLGPKDDVSKEHRTEVAVEVGRKLGQQHNKKP